jgi:UDP-N-acetylglucosamine:LPS N-acetylglucosamine transferase
MLKDAESKEKLVLSIIELIKDEERMKAMSIEMLKLAKPHAASEIAKTVLSKLEYTIS